MVVAPACSGKAAEPPEAVPGQGQSEVDRGLGGLEAPVAAGGLVGDGLPDAVAAQAVNEGGRALPGWEGVPWLAAAQCGSGPGGCACLEVRPDMPIFEFIFPIKSFSAKVIESQEWRPR